MLGHDVDFAYCRAPAAPLPCRRIFDCWWEAFDVERFVRRHFSEEDARKIVTPPKAGPARLAQRPRKTRKVNKDTPR